MANLFYDNFGMVLLYMPPEMRVQLHPKRLRKIEHKLVKIGQNF